MRIDHHVFFEQDKEVRDLLRSLRNRMDLIQATLEAIVATLAETLAAVTDEDTKVDGIIALLAGIKQQLADALSGTTLPAAVQAQVDQIFTQATASAGKIDAALTANVPTP